jgi:cation:H+ antiporter
MAALRRQTDVAFGNIIGSNIYNILGIGGATALISPTDVPREIVTSDNLVMIAVSVLVIVFAWTGKRISRREGGVLLAGYVGYIAWLWP